MTDAADLTDATPLDPEPERRMAAFRRLRSEGSVVPFPGADGILAAVSYEAVDRGLRTIDDFGGSAGQDDVPDVEKTIAALVEPRHGKVRRIINSVVAFHKSQRIEPYLQELSERLVDELVLEARGSGDDGVDVMARLAGPIPPAAMARLFGFPESDSTQFYSWMGHGGRRYQEATASGRSISIAEMSPELSGYIDQRISERQALPSDQWPQDALTRFLVTEVEGERLDVRSVKAQIIFMIGAGSDTTRNTIGNLIYHLGREPKLYAQIRNDRSLLDAVIEETLRIDPPAQWMVRTCRRPTELTGQSIEPGQKVLMCIGSANHDESVYDDPESFRIDRPTRDHLAFGSGPHICPGAPLARMEIRAALTAFLDRIESYRLVDPDGFDPIPTGMLKGPRTLFITVDREAVS